MSVGSIQSNKKISKSLQRSAMGISSIYIACACAASSPVNQPICEPLHRSDSQDIEVASSIIDLTRRISLSTRPVV